MAKIAIKFVNFSKNLWIKNLIAKRCDRILPYFNSFLVKSKLYRNWKLSIISFLNGSLIGETTPVPTTGEPPQRTKVQVLYKTVCMNTHRPLSDYWKAFKTSGFEIVEFDEPRLTQERFHLAQNEKQLQNGKTRPYSVALKLQKVKNS